MENFEIAQKFLIERWNIEGEAWRNRGQLFSLTDEVYEVWFYE